mgnify:CR=1 FL=1
MSTALITPKKLSGTIVAPPSKSYTHRAIICALLSRGICEIYPVEISNDVMATINAARTLGVFASLVSERLIIDARAAFFKDHITINCGESGSTLRFLIPIVSAFGLSAKFEGTSTLSSRPMDVFAEILPKFGVECRYSGILPFSISGRLQPGKFLISQDISSQFVTGLLFALPLLPGDSEIILATPCGSSGYVDMTVKTMEDFGVTVSRTEQGFKIPGNQRYCARNYAVEGDWSQAAFFLAAGAIGDPVTVRGVNPNSLQGDRIIANLLERMGAKVSYGEDEVTVLPEKLVGGNIFAERIPDLVPILAVLGACAEGSTQIFGASRLKFKESNRLKSLYDGLKNLGVDVTETDDGLLIQGQRSFANAKINGFNDHRIVMAFSVAAILAQEKVCISDAESISKSYPSFFEDYNKLGGCVNVLDL